MAAAYVGSAGGANGSGFGDELSFTTTRAVEVGERIVVIVRATTGVASVTVDAQALTADVEIGAVGVGFFSLEAVSQIASGATVLVTLTSEVSAGNKSALAEVIDGVDDTAPFRASVSNEAFGSSGFTGSTDGTPLAGDIALAIFRPSAASITGWTDGLSAATTGVASIESGFEELVDPGADSGGCTFSSGTDYFGALAVYAQAAEAAVEASLPMPHSRVPMPMMTVPDQDHIMRLHGRAFGA